MISRAVELVISGVARGAILSLFGLGITLVFGLNGILNLVIGVFAVGAVIACSLLLGTINELALAAVGGIVLVSLFALVLDQSIVSLIYRSEGEDRVLLGIFVTLGLSITFEGLLYIFYPGSYFLDVGVPSISVFGINVTGPSIAIIVLSGIAFVSIYYFFNRTYLGTASRTVIQDETGSVLCGIRSRRMQTIVFVLSAAIAATAGILYSFRAEVTAAASFELTVFAIVVSIVGGVDSIEGTMVAGVVLGVIVTIAGAVVGSYLSTVILFLAAIVVLVYNPEQIS